MVRGSRAFTVERGHTVSQTIPSISTEFATVELRANVELDAQPVSFVFKPEGIEPTLEEERQTAEWLTPVGNTRTAGVLVGPGAYVLAEGVWRIWWRLVDVTETPFRMAGGTVTIT